MSDQKQESKAPSTMKLDELLKKQARSEKFFTIEQEADDADTVKVTPWSPAGGCTCGSALKVPAKSISSVRPAGHTHSCCGKQLLVVEVDWDKDAKLGISEVFDQITSSSAGPERASRWEDAAYSAGPQVTAPAGTPGSWCLANPNNPICASYWQRLRCQRQPWRPECRGVGLYCPESPFPEVNCIRGFSPWAWVTYSDCTGRPTRQGMEKREMDCPADVEIPWDFPIPWR